MQQVKTILKVRIPEIVIERPRTHRAPCTQTIAVRTRVLVPALYVRIVVRHWILLNAAHEFSDGIIHREPAGNRNIGRRPRPVVHIDPGHRHASNMEIIRHNANTRRAVHPLICQSMDEDIRVVHIAA